MTESSSSALWTMGSSTSAGSVQKEGSVEGEGTLEKPVGKDELKKFSSRWDGLKKTTSWLVLYEKDMIGLVSGCPPRARGSG